jgi:hypothetical protein
MAPLTFGVLARERAEEINGKVFADARAIAVASFLTEGVCDLSSYAKDFLADSDTFFANTFGPFAARLRDDFYRWAPKPIRLPDLQAFFGYAFTLGINFVAHPLVDCEMEDAMTLVEGPQILRRQYPIRGPAWVGEAAHRERARVEAVFCAIHDQLIVPAFKGQATDGRYCADCLGLAFLWGLMGGLVWTKEAFTMVVASTGDGKETTAGSVVSCHGKRMMAGIQSDEIVQMASRLQEIWPA